MDLFLSSFALESSQPSLPLFLCLPAGDWWSRIPGKLLMIIICNFHVLSHLLFIYICKLHWKPSQETDLECLYELPFDDNTFITHGKHPENTALVLGQAVRSVGSFLRKPHHHQSHLDSTITRTGHNLRSDDIRRDPSSLFPRDTTVALARQKVHFLMIYICNFHVLNHFLLIYICKLHWNRSSRSPKTESGRTSRRNSPRRRRYSQLPHFRSLFLLVPFLISNR